MVQTIDQLFILLKAGLSGTAPEGFPVLQEDEWKLLLETAKRQTVTGVLYQGVSLLPEDYPLPENMLFTLMAKADAIRKRSGLVTETAQSLQLFYREKGLHPIVMKGPAVARFYPDPLLRISGDIDLYFPEEEYDAALSLSGPLVKDGDGSMHFKKNGVDIDLHKRYFDVHSKVLPAVPSSEAMLLMLSSHILKHAMGPGIGLRQICDIALAYKASDVSAERLRQCFRDAGLEKWNRLLFSFLHKYFDAKPLYDKQPSCEPILKIIFSGGNFGHYAFRRDKAISAKPLLRKMDTMFRFIKRIPFSLKYAPHEFFSYIGDLLKGNLGTK